MMTPIHAVAALATLTLAMPLLARTPECTALERTHWISPEALRAKLAWQGKKVLELSVAETCYRLRLEDTNGRKTEAYYDPVSGYPVRRRAM